MKTAAKKSVSKRAGPADWTRAAAEFDREMVIDTFEAPGAEAKAALGRAKRRRGRPKKGAGSIAISITVEGGLLRRADRLAQRLALTRAALVARGLRAVLAAQGDE